MAAATTREAARARVQAVVTRALERVIPADASVRLQGATFADFEAQVEEVARTVASVLLEERAKLSAGAVAENPGRCPHCGSQRTQFLGRAILEQVHSPHGVIVVPRQRARCRSCGRSFSPSAAGLGSSKRGGPDAACGTSGGTGGGSAIV